MPNPSSFERYSLWAVMAVALLGLAYAFLLRAQILRKDTGSERMQEVWRSIQAGANAYLGRQLRRILPLVAILTAVLFLSVYIVPPSREALAGFSGVPVKWVNLIIGAGRAAAFVLGSLFSLSVGQLGMRIAIQGNVRVAAASRRSFAEALRIAYRSGTFTGMLTDGLGLLGGTVIFLTFGAVAPDVLLGFGFGGTLVALFMRVGGGIYTKAADVGADLVGKVEQGMPEDDPRNAAVIADLVGDNVGDCAGMAADIFESYEVTIISGLILGLVLYRLTGEPRWVIFPMLVRAIGVAASIVGTYLVGARKGRANGNAMVAISTGFYTSAGISLPAIALLAVFYMGEWHAAISVALGIGLALGIDELTKAFTDTARRPVKTIAMASQTGSATLILRGLGVGFESAVWQMLAVAAAILGSIIIHWGLPVSYVLYGIAMTGIGMLTLTGNNVAMDSFGPISDNASGIGEMTHLKPQARQILAHLDEVGNTTKAITKGVAIGSAALAAVSLFSSFLTDITRVQQQLGLAQAQWLLSTGIRVSSPGVFIALLAGGALPWLFSSLTINAVARAASLIVEEVRRQLHIPGLLQGKVKPDYEKAVGICTAAAQRELLALALITITAPLLIGMLLGVEELGGFLAGAILSGQLLAVFMATAGGAWDNAKKSIEDGQYGGKGSEAHKASVVGDTVGDPLKDTAGPALNPMLKVINLVSLIAAPLLVHFRTMSPGLIAAAAACLVLFIGSIAYSKGENARKKLTGL